MVRKVLAVFVVLAVPGALGAQPQRAATARDLVGTWTLATVERMGGGAPTPVPLPRGLLVFDAAGHAFELASAGRRIVYAGNQPTPAEAHTLYNNYSGFWGSYKVADQKITYRPEGAVSPNAMGQEIVRSFSLKGDRLTVESASGEPDGQDQVRWTWERVPQLENLTPTNRQLLGFWRHVVERRVSESTGAVINEATRAPSVIVYTPAGYVGVHFPPLNRAKFAAPLPTDDEAQAAIRGFVSYYGAYTLYPGLVFHHRLMILGNGASDSLRRFFEINGDELTLKFPPGATGPLGADGRTNVVLKRISGAADMIR